ncbi:hypothetical protein C8F04DRAFT_1203191 [Mycena alexandri]|uniref:Uncharacterized protein n=1 Tax=Mycena alexandri TaxID=1745969 RepID=A0AAD6RXK9_9AGAR|nr:hypothetical protein C8F04DRAFT_1203191 [Mycena alexandri]
MATSTVSMSDCPEFMIQLTVPSLDTVAEHLADATSTRARYLTRHHIIPPTLSASSPTVIANPTTHQATSPRPANSVRISESAMPNFIPVHTDGGPEPLRENSSYDQFLTTVVPTEGLGPWCQVVGTLVFGNPSTPLHDRRHFKLEFDLVATDQSTPSVVYGQDLKKPETNDWRPEGIPGSPPLFWFPFSPESNTRVGDGDYMARYADGSFAKYTLWRDWIYLRPYWAPPPVHETDKPWLNLTFGVASKISRSYRTAPTSGILGLGRRSVLDNRLVRPPTFLQQIRPLLSTSKLQEIKGELGDHYPVSLHIWCDSVIQYSYITFGRRPVFTDGSSPARWHNHIPLLGYDHWMFASNMKKLNGKEYEYSSGTAELDTGAASCYVDDNFVKDYYALIPGCTTRRLGSASYNVIPVKTTATPRVELDIGGHLFTLERWHLPQAATQTIGSTTYYVGAIQPKSLLMSAGAAYQGPDIIGRVALVNMEVVFQVPKVGSHTMSWRRKDIEFAGPSQEQWNQLIDLLAEYQSEAAVELAFSKKSLKDANAVTFSKWIQTSAPNAARRHRKACKLVRRPALNCHSSGQSKNRTLNVVSGIPVFILDLRISWSVGRYRGATILSIELKWERSTAREDPGRNQPTEGYERSCHTGEITRNFAGTRVCGAGGEIPGSGMFPLPRILTRLPQSGTRPCMSGTRQCSSEEAQQSNSGVVWYNSVSPEKGEKKKRRNKAAAEQMLACRHATRPPVLKELGQPLHGRMGGRWGADSGPTLSHQEIEDKK